MGIKTFTLLLISVLLCSAQLSIRRPFYGAILKAPTAVVLLIDENFEGTGTPSGWATVGSPGFDNTSSPLSGAQDLKMDGAANNDANYVFTDAGEFWVALELKFSSVPAVSITSPIQVYNSPSFSDFCAIFIDTLGKLAVSDGTTSSTTTDTMSSGTKYYVWFHMLKGTGSNATIEGEFSTTNTRTGTGTKYAIVTAGNINVDLNYFLLRRTHAEWGNAVTFQVDNVRLSTTGWPP